MSRYLSIIMLILSLPSLSLPTIAATSQSVTPQEVLQLYHETQKDIETVVEKTENVIKTSQEWIEDAHGLIEKLDPLISQMEEIYSKDFDKQGRDLQIIALLEKYEGAKALRSLKISLKEEFKKTQNLGEAVASVKYVEAIVKDKLSQTHAFLEKVGSGVEKVKGALDDISKYTKAIESAEKTYSRAKKAYETLKPDADDAFQGLKVMKEIFASGAKYMPPPLDKALEAYAEVTDGFITALQALDKKIQENMRQGFTGFSQAFGVAFENHFGRDPVGIRHAKEFTEIEPSEVYVDEVEYGQDVFSFEDNQIQEWGVGYGKAKDTYDHYLKILPLVRERAKMNVKVPLKRFRLAASASRFREDTNQAVELLQKDLRESPGSASFLTSFLAGYFSEDTAGKVKAAVAVRTLELEGEEERLPPQLRGEIGASEGELASVWKAGREALNALLSFKTEVDLKDLAPKTTSFAKAMIPKIHNNQQKLDSLSPATKQQREEIEKLRTRWYEVRIFYADLSNADIGFTSPSFLNDYKNQIDRYNYVLAGKYRDEILNAAALKKTGYLQIHLPDVPAEKEGYSYRLEHVLQNSGISTLNALFKTLSENKARPLRNEDIDKYLGWFDSLNRKCPEYKTYLDEWKEKQEATYKELIEETKSHLGAAAKVKQEIESKYNFKILAPDLEPALIDSGITSYINKLEGEKKEIDSAYASTGIGDFLKNAAALSNALKKAKEVNLEIEKEWGVIDKEKKAYAQQTRKFFGDLNKRISLFFQYWIPLAGGEKILTELETKMAEVKARHKGWKERVLQSKGKIDKTPFASNYDGWVPLQEDIWEIYWSSGGYAFSGSPEETMAKLVAHLAERRLQTKKDEKKWEEYLQQQAEAAAKAPHAEIPLASIRVCGKTLSNGSVSITQENLSQGKMVIEGSLTNVRNGKVDYLSYTINDVDYGWRTKAETNWKHGVLAEYLPRYEQLKFAVFAHIGSYQSEPARFTVNYKRPEEKKAVEVGTLVEETQLGLRLEKARTLYEETSTINNYFKIAIAKNDIPFAKSLYLAVLDRKDTSTKNKTEADSLYSPLVETGYVPSSIGEVYLQIRNFDSDIQNVFSEMEKVLSTYVTDLANLKEISGNIGEGYNIEDILAGRGPTAGGGVLTSGTATLSENGDFDFSAGATTTSASQSDVGLGGLNTFFIRDPSRGAIQDMESSDFSTAPELQVGTTHFVTVTAGNYYAILTQEGHYAKLKVVSIGTDSISIEWWYQGNGSRQF